MYMHIHFGIDSEPGEILNSLELPGSSDHSLGFLYFFGYEFCMAFIRSYEKARYSWLVNLPLWK